MERFPRQSEVFLDFWSRLIDAVRSPNPDEAYANFVQSLTKFGADIVLSQAIGYLVSSLQTLRDAGHAAEVFQIGQKETLMNIEELIKANTAALEANTAALLKSCGATASTASAKATTAKGPKHTREEVNAVLTKVKDEKSKEDAKALIAEVGGVDKMALIPEAKFDAVYDAAVAKLAEEAPAEEAGEI